MSKSLPVVSSYLIIDFVMADLLELANFRERQIPLSVDAYHALGDMGFIPEKTELLEGFVVEKMPKSPLHNHLVRMLAILLRQFLGSGWLVQEEKPLHLGEFSEPEPDVSVVRGESEDFVSKNPDMANIVIEVACSTLAADRSKAAIYAKAGVPEYWIVRAEERVIELYSSPQGAEYRESRTLSANDDFVSGQLPGFALDWSRLFPQ